MGEAIDSFDGFFGSRFCEVNAVIMEPIKEESFHLRLKHWVSNHTSSGCFSTCSMAFVATGFAWHQSFGIENCKGSSLKQIFNFCFFASFNNYKCSYFYRLLK